MREGCLLPKVEKGLLRGNGEVHQVCLELVELPCIQNLVEWIETIIFEMRMYGGEVLCLRPPVIISGYQYGVAMLAIKLLQIFEQSSHRPAGARTSDACIYHDMFFACRHDYKCSVLVSKNHKSYTTYRMAKTTAKTAKKKSNSVGNKHDATAKTQKYIRFRPTFFQAKVLLFIAAIFVSYRYDFESDSVPYQDIYTILIASMFMLAKPSPYYRLMKRFSYPKVMAVLVYATFIFPTLVYAHTAYKDWDNAQLIKGLARDFPELVQQINDATGLHLEVKTNCMTTTEKSGNGVRTCEFVTGQSIIENQTLSEMLKIIDNNGKFLKHKQYDNLEGYTYKYRNKAICDFRSVDRAYASCVLAIRDKNIKLLDGL